MCFFINTAVARIYNHFAIILKIMANIIDNFKVTKYFVLNV